MVRAKVCVPCRNRKVRCDGILPECNSCCQSLTLLDCVYEEIDGKKGRGRILGYQEACLPCKSKKKRCDGTRPHCNRCTKTSASFNCIYPEKTSRTVRRRTIKGRFCRSAPNSLKLGCADSFVDSNSAYVDTCTASPTMPGTPPLEISTLSPPPPDSVQSDHSLSALSRSHFNFPLVLSSIATTSARFSSSPFSTIHTSEVDGSSAFALSDVSLDDMNMAFRFSFLSACLSFSMYFSFAKQQAILLGDLSNTFVHPFFVHFAHLVGCCLYQERRKNNFLSSARAIHLQLVYKSLATIKEEDDPLTLAQAYACMSVGYLYVPDTRLTKLYIAKCAEIVKKHLRFVPRSTEAQRTDYSRLEFLEEVRERAVFIARLLSTQMFSYLVRYSFHPFYKQFADALPLLEVFNYAEPMHEQSQHDLCLDLEDQFRHELPIAYPTLFEVCPIILRTKSMLFAKDANNLLLCYNLQSVSQSAWFSNCTHFLSSLTSHLNYLSSLTAKAAEVHDDESYSSLRYSTVSCLITFAEVYISLSRNIAAAASSLPTEFRAGLRSVVKQSVEDAKDLSTDDCPFLRVCWSGTLRSTKREVSQSSPLSFSASYYYKLHIINTFDDDDDREVMLGIQRIRERFVQWQVPAATHL